MFKRWPTVASLLIGIFALAIGGPSSPALAGAARSGARHAPIRLVRDRDGNAVPSVVGAFTSDNWSGYSLPKFATGVPQYTSAQATWIVPAVSFDGIKSASSSWIGIGGFCKNTKCKNSSVDKTLIQLGTEQDALSESVTRYYAWYEMLPQSEFVTGLAVNPGDVITASLTCAGECNKKQSWTLSMTNETTGMSWSRVVRYKSSKLSVDVIEEAPTNGSVLPLADFGTANFSQATANGSLLDLSTGVGIVMQDDDGAPRGCSSSPHCQSSNVSAPNPAQDGFDACFSPDNTLASCVDGSP